MWKTQLLGVLVIERLAVAGCGMAEPDPFGPREAGFGDGRGTDLSRSLCGCMRSAGAEAGSSPSTTWSMLLPCSTLGSC